jgi:hypothetical protein
MRVRLHVDRLVLENLTLPPGSSAGLRQALEQELTRTIAEGGLARWLARGVALPALRAPMIDAAGPPPRLGRAIAGAVYAGLGAPPPTPTALGRPRP